ncbi:MAG: alkylation repair protein [Rhizobacter sp.]|nr:alkylation repair protein [Rhizobacter sp.]
MSEGVVASGADGDTPVAALKEIFNAQRIRHIAEETAAVCAPFDAERFVALSLKGLDELSIMQRLRRIAENLHATLPPGYVESLDVLHALAPRLNSRFVTMVLPEFVALYGAEHFDASMQALKAFTAFGSSEFAIRHFLRRDLTRTLEVMTRWADDDNEHVRRLASEGSRPRLPWSFRLDALVEDPSPTAALLDKLKADPSLYVRKSVANHLNDITKDHPEWLLARIEAWSLDDPRTAWIAKHALRSLIKQGDKRALSVVGAGGKPEVVLSGFAIDPPAIRLGDAITLSFKLASMAKQSQRLVIDYAVHYVKKSGETSAKVFKLKTLTLDAGASVALSRQQSIRNFSTRVHYAGKHEVDLLVNGEIMASAVFDLKL